jgi:hypothetical protein
LQIGAIAESSSSPVSQIVHDPEPEIRELWDNIR